MYELCVTQTADKIFTKLSKKNKSQLLMIHKKIQEIWNNPTHAYKYLHPPLQGFNRVHIDTNFVIVFKINHKYQTVEVYYFDHHDNVYKWRPKPDETPTYK